MNYAIVLAGGKGVRLGADRPKQFVIIKDEPMIVKTIKAFNSVDEIDEIIVVCLEEYISYLNELVEEYSLNKVKKVVAGGNSRQLSVYAGLEALEKANISKDDIVLIHDGARPFVSKEIILNNIKAAKENDAAITVIKSTDSVLLSKQGEVVDSYLNRDEVYNCQTPQTFKFDLILKAHKKAKEDGVAHASDDASLVIRMNQKVSIVLGDVNNKKITYKEDL